ncbi:uncharacterized protein LOC110989278 isoform X2 [Acanthaster planci]|uniref:RING-type E3 ubiquitin transferase n=1 Tax=Acanthaster planci TaxID=133434 RepID=A0A8B7ZUZ7_ACAPL|nr:uncharacterized protein LOC110989278 isoform X2 [Acanthaster planci]
MSPESHHRLFIALDALLPCFPLLDGSGFPLVFPTVISSKQEVKLEQITMNVKLDTSDPDFWNPFAKTIGESWRDLCSVLGYCHAEIEMFATDEDSDGLKKIGAMLGKWCKANSDREYLIILVEKLRMIQRNDLIKELEKHVGAQLEHDPTTQERCIAGSCAAMENGKKTKEKVERQQVKHHGDGQVKAEDVQLKTPQVVIHYNYNYNLTNCPIVKGDMKDSNINYGYEFNIKLVGIKEGRKDDGRTNRLLDMVKADIGDEKSAVTPLKEVLNEFNLEAMGVTVGCVQLTVRVQSREDLERFWQAYISGEFHTRIKSTLPISEVRISEDVYTKGCRFFEGVEKRNDEGNKRQGGKPDKHDKTGQVDTKTANDRHDKDQTEDNEGSKCDERDEENKEPADMKASDDAGDSTKTSHTMTKPKVCRMEKEEFETKVHKHDGRHNSNGSSEEEKAGQEDKMHGTVEIDKDYMAVHEEATSGGLHGEKESGTWTEGVVAVGGGKQNATPDVSKPPEGLDHEEETDQKDTKTEGQGQEEEKTGEKDTGPEAHAQCSEETPGLDSINKEETAFREQQWHGAEGDTGDAVGTRVVRGPDWKWGDQDGGCGGVGTVVRCEASENKSTVWVRWDSGVLGKYGTGKGGGNFILRVYDNAQRGVKHLFIRCDGCAKMNVEGIRWKCLRCHDYDLCHGCYNEGRHELEHSFARIEEPGATGVEVPCRISARQCTAFGIFLGAEVVRGPDWKWDDQDGGVGTIGTVSDMYGADNSYRSLVRVQWSPGNSNVYTCGKEGKMDLQYTEKGSNGEFFIEHLPMLNMSFPSKSRIQDVKTSPHFAVGEKVRLMDMDLVQLMELQEKRCGWKDEMKNFKGRTGEVKLIHDDGDVLVQFGRSLYFYNPRCLQKKTSSDYIQTSVEGGKTLFRSAACGDINTVKETISKYPDAVKYQNECGITALQAASHRGHLDIVIALTEGKSSLEQQDKDGDTALAFAVMGNNPHVVQFLLLVGSDPNSSDENGLTPLHLSMGHCDATCAEVLLNHDQRLVKNQDIDGDTPLFFAIGQAEFNQSMTEMLIQHMTADDLRLQNNKGFNCLHHAALHGQKRAVENILKVAPSMINIAKEDGFTALHIAAVNDHTDVVETLLKQKNCNINALTEMGQTALDLAVEENHHKCIEVLVRHGARTREGEFIPSSHFRSEPGNKNSKDSNISDYLHSLDPSEKARTREDLQNKQYAQVYTEKGKGCKVQ